MADTRQTSRTDHVLEHLRADLLEGRIEPGARLKLPALSARFGVSMTVIREALTRMAEQGLVVSSPKRGFSVMPLSVVDLRDLTHARVRLEGMLLQDSVEIDDVAWESRVVASHHALKRTPYVVDGAVTPLWLQKHRDFHHALLSGSESVRLQAIAASLRDSAELYRNWARSLAKDVLRDVGAEHDAIVAAALNGDPRTAADVLVAHIERSAAALLEYAEGRTSPH